MQRLLRYAGGDGFVMSTCVSSSTLSRYRRLATSSAPTVREPLGWQGRAPQCRLDRSHMGSTGSGVENSYRKVQHLLANSSAETRPRNRQEHREADLARTMRNWLGHDLAPHESEGRAGKLSPDCVQHVGELFCRDELDLLAAYRDLARRTAMYEKRSFWGIGVQEGTDGSGDPDSAPLTRLDLDTDEPPRLWFEHEVHLGPTTRTPESDFAGLGEALVQLGVDPGLHELAHVGSPVQWLESPSQGVSKAVVDEEELGGLRKLGPSPADEWTYGRHEVGLLKESEVVGNGCAGDPQDPRPLAEVDQIADLSRTERKEPSECIRAFNPKPVGGIAEHECTYEVG